MGVYIVIALIIGFVLFAVGKSQAQVKEYNAPPQQDDVLKRLEDILRRQVTPQSIPPTPGIAYLDDGKGGSSGGDTSLPPPDVKDLPDSLQNIANLVLTIQPTVAQKQTIGNQMSRWDGAIQENSDLTGVDPVLIKAIIEVESGGNPLAINPVNKNISASELRSKILADSDGGWIILDDPTYRALNGNRSLDPSCGLMQVRVSTASEIDDTISPQSLLDGDTCIRVGSKHLANILAQGVTLDTIDAYNMGVGNLRKNKRNMDYRNKVNNWYEQFKNDFS